MNRVGRGEIYWLYPRDEELGSKLGLVLESDGAESLFAMCHPDIRMAGHLDAILEPKQTGLDYTIGIFTHVVQWVRHSQVGPEPVGRITESQVVDLERARSGQPLMELTAGQLLGDPMVEPRWALIEAEAFEFIKSLESNELGLDDFDSVQFEFELDRILYEWESTELTLQQKDKLITDCMSLADKLEQDASLCADVQGFWTATMDILGSQLAAA